MVYYSDNGMIIFFNYEEALATARIIKKPVILQFTGINCVKCKKMEHVVWNNPKVIEKLKEDFVIVSLYTDVQNINLDLSEQYYSKAMDKNVETLGDKNADLQVTKFAANTQPYYFFLDGNENKLAQEGYGYDPDVGKFLEHLEKVKIEFKKRQ